MIMEKIFIITTNSDKLKTAFDVANYISSKYDLDIAKTFSSNLDIDICKDVPEYFTYFDVNDMVIAFKNNAMLYCLSEAEKSIGISLDEYYNNDIFCMTVEAFNNISESLLMNMIVIWIDSKYTSSNTNTMNNVKILMNTLDSIKYMYFIEDYKVIKRTICEYLDASPKRKLELLEENS